MNYLKPVELTHLTINAQLFPSESILQSQAGVGIYDGKNKHHRYQDGTLYLTTHRLIYLDRLNSHHHSCFLDISFVRQTEYWIGFLTSSPKITLLLGPPPQNRSSQPSTSLDHRLTDQDHILNHPATSHWACHVCGFSNPPESKCGLCGVPRDLSSKAHSHSYSTLRPYSSLRESSSFKSTFQTRSLSDIRASSQDPQSEQFISPSINIPEAVDSTKIHEISCPSCTFLNHPSMARCEMCDSILGTVRVHNLISNNNNPMDLTNHNQIDLQHSRATTPAPPSSFPSGSYIRLSFRKGGDKSFYLNLKKSLQNKTWKIGDVRIELSKQQSTINNNSSLLQNPDSDSFDGQLSLTKPIGIDRILKNIDSQHQAHRAELTESLQDLQALMAKAKEMVQMAQSINARMSQLESSTSSKSNRTTTRTNNEEESEISDERKKVGQIRSSLVKLGLPAPAVTQDTVDNDQDFSKELAKELGGLLNRKMNYQQQELVVSSPSSSSLHNKDHDSSVAVGIWPLDEIWCFWNRARGISLVSPREMITACQHLTEYTRPKIQLRTFKSGLRVLHTSYFSLEEFESRLIERLTTDKVMMIDSHDELDNSNRTESPILRLTKNLSTLEIAHSERLNVNLTNELLVSIELGPLTTQLPPSSMTNSLKNYPSIVRDFNPSTGETSWFLNLISDFVWSDPNLLTY